MVFNSYPFLLVFLPLALLGWGIVLRKQNTFHSLYLLIVSLLFYAYWDWRNLFILCPSIIMNYLLGEHIKKNQSKVLLAIGIITNLSAIFYFKYADFVLSLIQGVSFNCALVQEKIPLGISFFTFTQIAYLIDAYYKKTSPANFSKYALFVTYFPHLIAGPLLHHKEMIDQFHWAKKDEERSHNFATGWTLLAFGLFKKVFLADKLGLIADQYFTQIPLISMDLVSAWTAAISYSLQLYLDFSGYSDMAIGISLFFGVKLPINFHSPYKATSIIDFWRRWHMSLSNFLRDYLYFPLGGSRKGFPRKLLNLLIVMFFCGIWHGAGITFVVWGLYHGVLLVINHTLRHIKSTLTDNPILQVLKLIITFYLVILGWVIFRSPHMDFALTLIQKMHTLGPINIFLSKNIILIVISLVFSLIGPNSQEMAGYIYGKKAQLFSISWLKPCLTLKPTPLWALIISGVGILAFAKIQSLSPFLYFQF